MADDFRHTPEGKASYAKRKETIERVFADAKEKHAMRYTHIRSLTRVRSWVGLKFAAMNLKKMALWMAKSPVLSPFQPVFRILGIFNPLPAMRQGVL
ncbi:MAG: transposase [Oscillospiraceae bacterium]|nr:transposase [Oscillospiraceae bacterium]